MVEEKKDVAKAVPLEPEVVNKDDLGFGGEDNKELMIIPRAKLIQGSSPEMKDENLNCRVGEIINSITKEKLPEVFVPIFFSTNWIRFNAKKVEDPGYDPDYELGAIIWRADSKNDPAYIEAEANFGPNGEKPLAVQFLNFICFFPEADVKMLMVSFAKTSFQAGRTLFSSCRSQPGASYAYKYKLGKQTKTGPTGDDYLCFTVSMAGKNEGEDLAKAAKIANEVKSKQENIVAHEDE